MDHSSTLAFIPARGGSKGVPKKNIKNLNGKPLIYYTLKLCQDINIPFLVSTDSSEIYNVCNDIGYTSEYKRPSRLAQDDSSMVDCVIHALDWINKESKLNIKNVLLLQPTSPLRKKEDIIGALSLFKKENIKSMFSVTPMREHPLECINLKDGSIWNYLIDHKKSYVGRQGYEQSYYFIDGSFYLSNVETILSHKRFLVEGISVPYVINQRYSIDIDTIQDFEIVEYLMRGEE